MSGGASAYLAGEILNFTLRGISPTVPATIYFRQLTTPSTKTSSGTEGSFPRIAFVRGTSIFTDPLLTSQSTNVDPILTDLAGASGSPIVAFDFVNTASGAFTETYLFGTVTPARDVVAGKRIRYLPGQLLVTS